MKKRLLSVLLALCLLIGLLPVAAMAAEAKTYGQAPIYFGDVYIDYMAQEILKQIDLEGKTDVERIRAVYDWIIRNCWRAGDETAPVDQLFFDIDTAETQAEGPFYQQMLADIAAGSITLRIDVGAEVTTYDPETGFYYLSCDANEYVAYAAGPMMLYRVGECHNFAGLLVVLLGHLGYDCRLIDGEFLNNDGTRAMHKWNMVLLDGKYYWLDVRMDQEYYKSNGTYRYFMVEDTAQWETKHSWDHSYSDAMMDLSGLMTETYTNLLKIPGQVEEVLQPWSTCSDWAEPFLTQAVEKGIYPQVFAQADMTADISRAEFASVAIMFYEALSGQKAPAFDVAQPLPFTDVTAADADVLAAYQLKIVNGIGGGKFDPKGTLTREQAVTMLGRVCELVATGAVADGSGLEKGAVQVPAFADEVQIDSWARAYVDYFVSRGVVEGVGNNSFAPDRNMTREEAMKVAVAALDQ